MFVWGNVLAFNFHACIPTLGETTDNQNITQPGFVESQASCVGIVRWVSTHSTALLTSGRQNVRESCSVKCRDETVGMLRILSGPCLFVTEAMVRPVVRGIRFPAFCSVAPAAAEHSPAQGRAARRAAQTERNRKTKTS